MVDSVQNNGTNNTALYTTTGAVLGAAGGGAAGKWLTKPYLQGDAPSDTFIRTAHDTLAEAKATKNAESLKEAKKEAIKDMDIDALKNEVKTNAKDYGLVEVKDAEGKVTKTLDKVVEEYIGSETDKAKLSEKMLNTKAEVAKKAAMDAHVSGAKLGDAIDEIGKLADDASAEDIKAAVKKHADAFGIKGEGDALDSAVNSFVSGKDKNSLKTMVEEKLKTTKETVEGFFDGKKLKAEADIAEDAKPAFKAVKEAIGKMTNKAALKWGGIAAGSLALIGLLTGMATKKAPAPAAEDQHISTQA